MTTWPIVGDGKSIRPSHITTLQDAINGVQDGTVPIALAGIADALGTWVPSTGVVANARAGRVSILDYAHLVSGGDWQPAIQAAIDSEAGIIDYPITATSYTTLSPLVPKSNQIHRSATGLQYRHTVTSVPRARIKGDFDGPVFAPTGVDGVSFDGLTITGSNNAAHGDSVGVKGTTARFCTIRNCMFDAFGGAAVEWVSGVVLELNRNFTTNCRLKTTGHSDYVGVFDLSYHDPIVSYNEVGSNQAAIDTGYVAAIVMRGSNGFFFGNQAEISEVGIVVTGSWNSFLGNRADLNWAQGWIVPGKFNRFVGNWSHQNGQETTDTYDAFWVTSTGQGNLFVGNNVTWNSSGNVCRYGFASAAEFSDASQCTFIGNAVQLGAAATGDYNLTAYDGMARFVGRRFIAYGGLGVGNSATATTLGTVTKKIEVFDAAGVSLGFVPVYGSIT